MDRLERPFEIIAFDWDGTAVASRQADATAVCHRLERLLKHGVYIVVITGTNFQNVDRQLSSTIAGSYKRRLFVCTNRGSEVYGFDQSSRPTLLWRRVATAEENRQLSTIAEHGRRNLERRTGLDVDIVYNRLNRRKIDLIPLPEWRDPPKEAIGELLRAVESRLKAGGIAGGIQEVIGLVEQLAGEEGLADPRITSDVKHVELGLTDKGDSVAWMIRELVEKQGLSLRDVLIAGDEFGPIDGFPGSDYKMVPPAKGAVFVSVGKEPKGVPPEVIDLGGGPVRFLELLDRQIALHERERPKERAGETAMALEPTAPVTHRVRPNGADHATRDSWLLIEEGFSLAREHEIESIFSIGNGYLGTRGSLGERSPVSRPATFVAGVFDIPPNWSAGKELAKAPDWTHLKVYVDGEELRLDQGEMLDHRRILDLQQGLLRREWRHRDRRGRVTRLSYLRFASLADRHALAESVTIFPENYGARLIVEAGVDGTLAAPGELQPVQTPSGERALVMKVAGSDILLAFVLSTVFTPSRAKAVRSIESTDRLLAQRWEFTARLGQSCRVDKLLSVYSSRDGADPIRMADDGLRKLHAQGFDGLLEAHSDAWNERWQCCDLEIPGNKDDQRGIRFAIYHLVSGANPDDPQVSIGARGLTGEAYKGHVFWDTEIFMLPFYSFTDPAAARTLLRYRYNTLPAARARAGEMGYRGALYAWESTTNGEDVTPRQAITPDGKIIPILCGEMEHHISADVSYAVRQYVEATGDDDFWLEAGAEIVLETARFWASRSKLEADGRYHIRHVIGPDEYHEDVDDNAYTNVMAQWNIEQGLAAARTLAERWPQRWQALSAALELEQRELDQWRDVAEHMFTGFDPHSGLYEQFAGYFGLEDIDLKAYEPRTAPLDVFLGRPRVAGSQVLKQPDVIMLLYLLWDRIPPEVREKNFRYYEPRCDHGSSLSPAIHAAVAARLGDTGLACRYFRQTVDIDLANNMGNAAMGVHIGAQGALWQAAALGFAGLHLHEDHPAFEPHLPADWQGLCFKLHWRNRRLRFASQQSPTKLEVELQHGESMPVVVGETAVRWIGPEKPRAVWRRRAKHY